MVKPVKKPLEVTFLGTGTSIGVPVIACNCPVCKSPDARDKRFRTSALIKVGDVAIVIDCGPDFRFQMLKNNVDNLDSVVFTHEHRDHVAGLDDIRAFNYILNKTIDIYGSEGVMHNIRTEFPYIFSESRYFGAPQLTIHVVEDKPFEVNGIPFIPIHVMHDKLMVLGYRIFDFTYITDASFISDAELEKVKGSKVVVLNALRNSKHVSHFSLAEAVEVINRINPERAYLTHISHFLGLHEEVERKLPANIRLAYDNLSISI
ncbi:MAG: MBL fold metallo-hydrolase [Bacteroidales bacterium]